MAIGTRALIVNDTLNPKNGFTTADFQRFAARFDTLVYPLDSAAFGPPTDIDDNGHVVLVFTRAVNELTPANVSCVCGRVHLLARPVPIAASSDGHQGCPASNEGEYFYLLTPDPAGQDQREHAHGRLRGFHARPRSIAHEFQHLINASRRIYVNNAPRTSR